MAQYLLPLTNGTYRIAYLQCFQKIGEPNLTT